MAIKTPNLKSMSSKIDSEVRLAFESIKTWLNAISSDGGPLTANSLAQSLASDPATSHLFNGTIPAQCRNLVVTGAFRAIMLTWDQPICSYVEVWRHTTDDLGAANMIGTTSSAMYSDVPQNAALSANYYYWVRAVSSSGIKGPFNSTAGTKGSTASDPDYLIEVLSKDLDSVTATYLNTYKIVIPAEQFAIRAVDSNGVAVPRLDNNGNIINNTAKYPLIVSRTYQTGDVEGTPTGPFAVIMDTAFIGDATIGSAKIRTLSADKLTVPGTASIWSAIITSGAITNAYIGDTIESGTGTGEGFVSSFVHGSSGWKIDKTGNCEFNGGTFRGKLEIGTAGSYTDIEGMLNKTTDVLFAFPLFNMYMRIFMYPDWVSFATNWHPILTIWYTSEDITGFTNVPTGYTHAMMLRYSACNEVESDAMTVVAGTVYTVDYVLLPQWVGTNYTSVTIVAYWWNGTTYFSEEIIVENLQSSAANQWQIGSHNITAPATATKVKFRIYNASVTDDVPCYVARFQVTYPVNPTGWRKPGSTFINGNQIWTGDAYVDTLQIKGRAVTLPEAAAQNGGTYSEGTNDHYGVILSVDITIPPQLSSENVAILVQASCYSESTGDNGWGINAYGTTYLHYCTVVDGVEGAWTPLQWFPMTVVYSYLLGSTLSRITDKCNINYAHELPPGTYRYFLGASSHIENEPLVNTTGASISASGFMR